jgi:hypothetical protein
VPRVLLFHVLMRSRHQIVMLMLLLLLLLLLL